MNVHVRKSVPIEFIQVVKAYQKARKGGKATGIDDQSWEGFDKEQSNNLYVIWNRLASGSYHPKAVKEVEIPKKDGKKRKLGIPTLRDRIAQQVVKDYMEKKIDHLFHEDSYGYRPRKNAHQAIEKVKQNCYKRDWVIDMDICKFFDEIDHELMLKAVKHVLPEKWVETYVKRWLEMPIAKQDGKLQLREGKGTPQGGVISPLLANLYLHFAIDMWLTKHYPHVFFARYADDMVVHCKSKKEAEKVLEAIKGRLAEVKLQIKPEKTRIAYCKDYRRKEKHEVVQFDYLGFSYRPRASRSKRDGKIFMAFTAEISQTKQKRLRDQIREVKFWRHSLLEVKEVATLFNAKLRGWINYYGKYSKRSLRKSLQVIDRQLIKWIRNKHKISRGKSLEKLKRMKQDYPNLFYHWKMGY